MATKYIEEATHFITEVINGEAMRKIYREKIKQTPTMDKEQSS